MNKPNITIVILNYNSIDYLKECLRSIENSELNGLIVETIVVDNASTDESVKVLRKDYKDARLIASKKNNGFAAGNNLAVNKIESKYVLFLNPDTVLEKDVLYKIFNYMEKHENVGAATCKLELFDGRLDYSSHRGFPTPLNAFFYFSGIIRLFPKNKFFSGYTQGWKLDDLEPHEVNAITGAFFFVRREVGRKDFLGLETLREVAGERFHRGVVLYGGSERVAFGRELHALPLSSVWRLGARVGKEP